MPFYQRWMPWKPASQLRPRPQETGANHTATLTKANAGRAAYISAEQLEGHIDPGAEAVARLFEHLAA